MTCTERNALVSEVERAGSLVRVYEGSWRHRRERRLGLPERRIDPYGIRVRMTSFATLFTREGSHIACPEGLRSVRKKEGGAMNITITFRHMQGTSAVKSYANEKIAKLQKFLRQAMTAQVTLSVEGLNHIAEVHVSSGSTHFHATERSEDMYASIDMVHDKLERQIRGAKGATVARKRGGTSAREFAENPEMAAVGSSRTRG